VSNFALGRAMRTVVVFTLGYLVAAALLPRANLGVAPQQVPLVGLIVAAVLAAIAYRHT